MPPNEPKRRGEFGPIIPTPLQLKGLHRPSRSKKEVSHRRGRLAGLSDSALRSRPELASGRGAESFELRRFPGAPPPLWRGLGRAPLIDLPDNRPLPDPRFHAGWPRPPVSSAELLEKPACSARMGKPSVTPSPRVERGVRRDVPRRTRASKPPANRVGEQPGFAGASAWREPASRRRCDPCGIGGRFLPLPGVSRCSPPG